MSQASIETVVPESVMGKLRKVLVVDDGTRAPEDPLSGELAELGFASVTASVEALDDVLALMSPLAAILVQLPQGARHQQFIDLAERLKADEKSSGVPVVMIDRASAMAPGGYASMLQDGFETSPLSQPDF